MENPIRQHYIPKVYLKNFTDENNKLWVYDKQENTLKYLSLRDTTVVKNLYTIIDTEGNKNFSIEEFLGKNESKIVCIYWLSLTLIDKHFKIKTY